MENISLLNNKFRMLMVALLGLTLMLVMAPKAKAATYTISPTCTLNQAFEAINTPAPVGSCPAGEATNTINIPADSNPYVLSANLEITNGASVTIVGAGPGQSVIDGVGTYSVGFGTATDNATFDISGLTFKDLTNLAFQSAGTANLGVIINNINVNGINPSGGGGLPSVMVTNGGDGTISANITKSSFYSNTSETSVLGFGAGFNEGATGNIIANITNNTIANNTAPATIGLNNGTELGVTINMINNTIAGNTGGIIAIPEGSVSVTYNLTNNIFSNSGDNCPASGPAINSLGGNISSDATCAAYFTQSTDQNSTDPQLGSLAQDSGTGTYVMPITQSSPAFNKGISSGAPATDQRGITRPQAGVYDSGAYELVASTPIPTPNNNGTLASTGNDARIPLALAAILVAIGAAGSVVALKRR